MARRKHKKTTHRRYHRRSVGAVGGQMVMDIAGLTIGALLAKQVGKLLPSLDSKIQAVGKIALGVLLPNLNKTPIVKGIGNGMIAVGGAELIGGFVPSLGAADDVVLLSGIDQIGADEMGLVDNIGGDVAEINGDVSEINGYDEF
jgi:hypothetical protein